MKQVLEATETTSKPFTVYTPIAAILLADHAGGTWKLQVLKPGGDQDVETDWVDDEYTATDNGLKAIYTFPELLYRITGGDVGAEAWLLQNMAVPGVKI